MHKVIILLAVLGIVISAVALKAPEQARRSQAQVDCAVVNGSGYARVAGVPVGAIGVVGYLALAILAGFHRRGWTLVLSWAGLGFAAYLSYIEGAVLGTWCAYCIISQVAIALIALLAIIDVGLNLIKRFGKVTTTVDAAIKTLRYG